MSDATNPTAETHQLALELATQFHLLTRTFPEDDRVGLGDPIRHAAVQIAAHFAPERNKYTTEHIKVANSCRYELEVLLEMAHRLGLLADNQFQSLTALLERVGEKIIYFGDEMPF
jgi:four helix bundle protein